MTTRVKQPGESLVFEMDFVNLLMTGDSLASIDDISVTPDDGDITIGVDEVIVGTGVQVTISGGVDQTTYHFEFTVTTTNGETLEGDGYLLVTDTPEYLTEFPYTYRNLRTALADYLGWGRNTEGVGTSWSEEDSYRLDAIIKSGLTQVYFPEGGHQWSWMRPTSTLTTSEPYDTGTVGITSGVVTLAGGTWPSWAAQAELEVEGEVYAVDTRDSDSQLTLKDTSVTVTAGATYTLPRYMYDLPLGFVGLEGDMTYPSNQSELYPPVSFVQEAMVRRLRQQNTYSDRPRYVAIRPKTFNPSTGQYWQAVFYPTPDAAYDLEYRYRVQPNMLSDAYPNPMGGPDIGELILESCLAIAEQRYRDEQGLHTEAFMRRLAAAIQQDQRAFAPEFLGYNADRSDHVRDERWRGIAIHSFEGNYYYD